MKNALILLGLSAAIGITISLIMQGGAAFGAISTLSSSDTQNTERGIVNQLVNSVNNFSTTTANTFTAHNIFSSLNATSASTTNATTTNLDITGFLTFNEVTGNSWNDFCVGITSSASLCDGNDVGAWPFVTSATTYATSTQSTSTPLWLRGNKYSLFASSTSVFDYASTTALTIFDRAFVDGTLFAKGASTTALSNFGTAYFGGTATSTFDSAGVLTLATDLSVANGGTGASTLTGILQGNGTSAFTAITNPSASGQVLRYSGVPTIGWGALDLSDSDAITGSLPIANGGTATTTAGSTNGIWYNDGTNIFTNTSSLSFLKSSERISFTHASSTAITASGTSYAATASSTNLIVSGLTSAVLQAGSNGTVAEATATSCTNQFVRAMSAAYAATCATVAPTDVDLTASWDFGGASGFEIPNGAAPVVDVIGEIALDTTTNQLLVATSTNASFPAVFSAETDSKFIASTSTLRYMGAYAAAGTTTLKIEGGKRAKKITDFYCAAKTTGSGTSTVAIGSGTATSSYALSGDFAAADITTAISIAARGTIYVDFGTLLGTPDYHTCTITTLDDRL